MEVAARISRLCALLAALACCTGAQAREACWLGDAANGRLGFSGALEGEPFEGEFRQFSVRYCDGAGIEVRVNTKSATVGRRDGDDAMAGDEFFHPTAWPEATWTGDAPVTDGASHKIPGTLTIRGIALEVPITLAATLGDGGLRLQGETVIERLDFDVGIGEFEDTSFLANAVGVHFDLELKQAP